MQYIPEQGDIIWIDFDPSSGKEIMKRRPGLVISRKLFNEHTDLVIVAPITSTIRGIKLEIVLPAELEIKGAVLVHQLKSLDYATRNAKLIEKAPAKTIEQATHLAQLIVK